MKGEDLQMLVWTARFVVFLGTTLIVCTIFIANQALSATTIWYVLIPGLAIGLVLSAIGMLGTRVARELSVEPNTCDFASHIVLGLALGTGFGVNVGVLAGNLAVGISLGTLLGFPAGLALCLTARRLTRR